MKHPSLTLEENNVKYEVGMVVTQKSTKKDYIVTSVSSKADPHNLYNYSYVMAIPVEGVVITREDESEFATVRSKLSTSSIVPKEYSQKEKVKQCRRKIDEALDIGDKEAFKAFTELLNELTKETAND